jgi:hypothetical protein
LALIVVVAGALALSPATASAIDVGSIIDPVTHSLGTPVATDHFLATDVDPSSLVVTDSEVADAGPATADAMDSQPPTLVVDDDKVQCPNAQFTSIQAAVLAAQPGDRILVCPGDYKEKVVVTFLTPNLTIVGIHPSGWTNQCQAPVVPDPTQEAILDYPTTGTNPDFGFNLAADGTSVAGFFVRPSPAGPKLGLQAVGIFSLNSFSGYRIFDNVLQGNSQGVYPNSSGTNPTSIKHNCFRDNNHGGPATGTGLYTDEGLHNATISDNYFTLDQNAAIIIDTFLTKPSNLMIAHNASVDDAGIVLNSVDNSVVTKNFSLRSAGSAIYVGGNTNGLQITQNLLKDGSFNGISIHDTQSPEPGPNLNLLIERNKITGFALNGVRLAGAGATNVVRHNRSEDNAQDGLHAAGGTGDAGETSANFLIQRNMMRFNATFDCYDGNVPTLNTWVENKGFTENQPGLCKHGNDNEGQENENDENESEAGD